MKISRVYPTDDTALICSQVKGHLWAEDNEMTDYKEAALKEFLADKNNFLVLAWDKEKIAGIALCYIMKHPEGSRMLYIHELDTHPDYRNQGVATKVLQYIKEYAQEHTINEVWLGTEQDNDIANKLYTALEPTEIEQSVTYTYAIKD